MAHQLSSAQFSANTDWWGRQACNSVRAVQFVEALLRSNETKKKLVFGLVIVARGSSNPPSPPSQPWRKKRASSAKPPQAQTWSDLRARLAYWQIGSPFGKLWSLRNNKVWWSGLDNMASLVVEYQDLKFFVFQCTQVKLHMKIITLQNMKNGKCIIYGPLFILKLTFFVIFSCLYRKISIFTGSSFDKFGRKILFFIYSSF